MAKRPDSPGHMLRAWVSRDHRVPQLMKRVDERLGLPHGAKAIVLFTWVRAHTDCGGRMFGHPAVVFGQVIPLLEVDVRHVQVYLAEAARLGLLHWYEVEGQQYVADPRFDEDNIGLKIRGESPLPAPTEGAPVTLGRDGAQSDLFGNGATTAPRRRQASAEKASDERHRSAPPPPPPPPYGAQAAPSERQGGAIEAPGERPAGAPIFAEEKRSEEKGNEAKAREPRAREALPPAPPPPLPPPPRRALRLDRETLDTRWRMAADVPGLTFAGVGALADHLEAVAAQTEWDVEQLFDAAVSEFKAWRETCSQGMAPELTPYKLVDKWSTVWERIAGSAPTGKEAPARPTNGHRPRVVGPADPPAVVVTGDQ